LMRTRLTERNPFGPDAKGFLWERLDASPGRTLLDFGAHDGSMLRLLLEGGRISGGVGLDANADVVRASSGRLPEGVKLRPIAKNEPFPFPDGSFDAVSAIGVLEHVRNQDWLLHEIGRVVKPGGQVFVAVPGKYLLSSLDLGNWKFTFPRIHRLYYSVRFGRKKYDERYVACANGLIGDIETEKAWHEHFRHGDLAAILARNGLAVTEADGAGFFYRLLLLARSPLLPRKIGPLEKLLKWDAMAFHQAEIFVLARKK
jgi:SAM-dependent methyltransferase